MSYGVMADLHAHNWQLFSSTDSKGINSRLSDICVEIVRCAGEVSNQGGTKVIIAGDVFHTRGAVAPSVFNTVRNTMKRCAKEFGVEFHILCGNHDLEGPNSEALRSSVAMLSGTEGIQVYHKPTILSADIFTEDAAMIALVPWYEDIEELKSVIVGIRADNPGAEIDLFIHAGISGVFGNIPASKTLDPAWLASLGFRGVYAGHFHDYKSFPGNVHSIGAPTHHTWRDVGSIAGFGIVKPSGRFEHHHTSAPCFHYIDSSMDLRDISLFAQNNFIRAKVTNATTAAIESWKKQLKSWGARAVVIESIPAKKAVATTRITSLSSLEKTVESYLDSISANERVREIVKNALEDAENDS